MPSWRLVPVPSLLVYLPVPFILFELFDSLQLVLSLGPSDRLAVTTGGKPAWRLSSIFLSSTCPVSQRDRASPRVGRFVLVQSSLLPSLHLPPVEVSFPCPRTSLILSMFLVPCCAILNFSGCHGVSAALLLFSFAVWFPCVPVLLHPLLLHPLLVHMLFSGVVRARIATQFVGVVVASMVPVVLPCT